MKPIYLEGEKNKRDQWFFRMRASNGRIIQSGSKETYPTKSSMMRTIDGIMARGMPGMFVYREMASRR